MTARRYDPRAVSPPLLKGLMLFLLPLPLLFAGFVALAKGELGMALATGGSFALFMLGAGLARRGLMAERDYQRRRLARAPRTPRKLLGGLVIGLASGSGAFFAAEYGLLNSLAFAAATLIGFFLAYGTDPRADKLAGAGVDTEELTAALEEGQRAIEAIGQARDRLRNPELRERLGRITAEAQQILQGIEEDPKDLRRARKFLVVYLEGTQRVAEGYARTHHKLESGELEENFRRILDRIEQVFRQQRARLLEDEVLDLDVQIEVLRKQLQEEGLL